jgi:uncharacterized protein (UPF0179 family)
MSEVAEKKWKIINNSNISSAVRKTVSNAKNIVNKTIFKINDIKSNSQDNRIRDNDIQIIEIRDGDKIEKILLIKKAEYGPYIHYKNKNYKYKIIPNDKRIEKVITQKINESSEIDNQEYESSVIDNQEYDSSVIDNPEYNSIAISEWLNILIRENCNYILYELNGNNKIRKYKIVANGSNITNPSDYNDITIYINSDGYAFEYSETKNTNYEEHVKNVLKHRPIAGDIAKNKKYNYNEHLLEIEKLKSWLKTIFVNNFEIIDQKLLFLYLDNAKEITLDELITYYLQNVEIPKSYHNAECSKGVGAGGAKSRKLKARKPKSRKLARKYNKK